MQSIAQRINWWKSCEFADRNKTSHGVRSQMLAAVPEPNDEAFDCLLSEKLEPLLETYYSH